MDGGSERGMGGWMEMRGEMGGGMDRWLCGVNGGMGGMTGDGWIAEGREGGRDWGRRKKDGNK